MYKEYVKNVPLDLLNVFSQSSFIFENILQSKIYNISISENNFKANREK